MPWSGRPPGARRAARWRRDGRSPRILSRSEDAGGGASPLRTRAQEGFRLGRFRSFWVGAEEGVCVVCLGAWHPPIDVLRLIRVGQRRGTSAGSMPSDSMGGEFVLVTHQATPTSGGALSCHAEPCAEQSAGCRTLHVCCEQERALLTLPPTSMEMDLSRKK